jgi:hypothetical protein
MVDMKQKLYSFQNQLENQHKSRVSDLERQHKTRISTLEKSIAVKDKEIGKLSSTIFQLKNEKKDIKKSATTHIYNLKDVIFAKDLKIITLNDRIVSFNPSASRDGTIEPSSYFDFYDTQFWVGKHENAKNDLSIRKKYTFRKRI